MSRRFLITTGWCALLSCAVSGCYSHHQSPYGGTYPGPYGAPGPYQTAPGTVVPEGTAPPGSYPVQPNLGQPVPPPQGALPPNGSQASNDAFPSNTNYDGVDTQWKQPINSTPGSDGMNAPLDANSTASGRNAPPGSSSSSPSGNQAVPSYQDPNQIRSDNPPASDTFPQNNNQQPPSDPFPSDSNDQFQSNQNPQPQGGSTQMNDQFGTSGNDQFQSNKPDQFQESDDQFQENNNEGFSVPSPVQQQSFESEPNAFDANPKKFDANQSVPDDTFNQNSIDSSQEFQPPVNSFPGNDDTFDPNSSSTMKPSTGKVSHANHQTPATGPQLVQSNQFMPPTKFQPASFEFPSDENQNSTAQAPSPFNYDRQNYRWLRGVVEFDKQENSWNITYNPTPDRTDKFGGNIVLIDQGKLNRFKNGDVVLIDGHIDGSRQDRMGKPCYFISKAQRLVPKK